MSNQGSLTIPPDKAPRCADCAHWDGDTHYPRCNRPGPLATRWDPVTGWNSTLHHRNRRCREERQPWWHIDNWDVWTRGRVCGPKGDHFAHKKDDKWPAGG